MKRDALQSKPNIVRKRPVAYFLDNNQTVLIEKLKTLGIEVTQLDQNKSYLAETYTISSYDKNYQPYEQMLLQDVETNITQQNLEFKKGTYIIKMNQKRANLAAEILEPESPNSFVSFGVLETKLGELLPIYRIIK
ncbi:MAG: hypothetical protein HC798_03600 [Polaribacter sp.]|nr:hypothetical protein [Polaribacter sp.]